MNSDDFKVLFKVLDKLNDLVYVNHFVKGSFTVIVFKEFASKEEFSISFDNASARLVLGIKGLLNEMDWRYE